MNLDLTLEALEVALARATTLLNERDPLSRWFDERAFVAPTKKGKGKSMQSSLEGRGMAVRAKVVNDSHPWPHLRADIQARVKPFGSEWIEGSWQRVLEKAHEEAKDWLMFEMQKHRRQMGRGYLFQYMRDTYNPLMHPSTMID